MAISILRRAPYRPVEEVHDACLQGIFGADHHEPGILDQILNDVGSMAQMIHRGADVGAHGFMHQRVVIGMGAAPQQAFDRRSDEIHDGMQIARLVLHRTTQLFQRRFDGPAAGVSEYHHQPRAELFSRKFDAADQGRSDDVARDPDDEQISQTLIEHDLDGNARIGAAENGGKRLLTSGNSSRRLSKESRLLASDTKR